MNANDTRETLGDAKTPKYDFLADKFKSGTQAYTDAANAWKALTEIPGAMDLIKGDPKALAWSQKNPVAALANYQKAIGGGTGVGDGTSPRSKIRVDGAISMPGFRSADSLGLRMGSGEDLMSLGKLFDDAVANVGKSADKIASVNDAFMRGELAGDVTAEIRRNSAEKALSSGSAVDAQMSRNLRARDLGLASTQLQQQGIQNQGAIAELHRTVAGLAESRREFVESYNANVAQFLDNVRKTDLTGIALEQERLQFNSRQNLGLIQLIASSYEARGRIQASLASADIDTSGVSEDFDNLIEQMDKLLG